jgi:hypothetical protein
MGDHIFREMKNVLYLHPQKWQVLLNMREYLPAGRQGSAPKNQNSFIKEFKSFSRVLGILRKLKIF